MKKIKLADIFYKLIRRFRMKNIIFLLILLLAYSVSAQTLLLKPGNAAQYWYEMDIYWKKEAIGTITIDGKTYTELKTIYAHVASTSYSYERIDGDSVHYVRLPDGSDSLSFNFNWKVGKIICSDTLGNTILLQFIDSIKKEQAFTFDDTVYYLKNININIQTGDTLNSIPHYTYYSKLFGQLNFGIWTILHSVKVNGGYYGGKFLGYQDEVIFTEDSLYIPTIFDSASCWIKNVSNVNLVLDTILTSSIYGYRVIFSNSLFKKQFSLFRKYPYDFRDTLNLIIPRSDSVRLGIFGVDLCPICKTNYQNEFFKDTLIFLFHLINEYPYAQNFSLKIPISGYGIQSEVQEETIPTEFRLFQNYPNPFNSTTKIKFQIPNSNHITLKIFDILGREVITLINEEKSPGEYEVQFTIRQLTDDSRLTSGVYFYQLRAGSYVETKKMVLQK